MKKTLCVYAFSTVNSFFVELLFYLFVICSFGVETAIRRAPSLVVRRRNKQIKEHAD